MERVLVGHKIAGAEVVPDTIIFGDTPPEAVRAALEGRTVKAVGRKGKTWWIETDGPVMFGHLGMAGWVREIGAPTTRIKEQGNAPLDDADGRPRFLKLLLTTEAGKRIAVTDQRRLGRIWLADKIKDDSKWKELGPDALNELPQGKAFAALFKKRNAPIKALLMDQSILSGIGNWLADEVLYHSRIAPQRLGSSLTEMELKKLRKTILEIIQTAVDAGADETKYPTDWIFHVRWGGNRGHQKHGKYDIVREQVGGRTTAWVPALQK